jgi:hypothetical protein
MHLLALLFAAKIAATPTIVRCNQPIPERARALFTSSGIVLTWQDGVEVLDPASGERRWRQQLSRDERNERPIAAISDRVIVSDRDSLSAYAIDSGTLVWSLKRGRVRHLTADRLLMAHVTLNGQSRILIVNPETGVVMRERIARESESMVAVPGAILDVQLPNESDGAGYIVVAYDPSDLHELWRFRQSGSASFLLLDDVLYFTNLSDIFPIDLKTGARGAKLPPTGDVDSLWGGSSRELETTDDVDGSSRLRRNEVMSGKPVWTTDVPFEILNTLQDGDTLFVFGGVGLENDPHYVATIEWKTGRLLRVTGPVPFVFQWGKVGSSIVATTWDDRFVCFQP